MRNVLSRGRFQYTIPKAQPNDVTVELAPEALPAPPPDIVVPQQPKQLSRKDRRRNEVFNRRLKKRIEKDGTPARVEVLPDGGIHVHVDTREPKG